MNCCDTYGQCTQGRDCPARTGVVLPHQAAHAKKCHSECATEAGNVWFAKPEPTDESVLPMNEVLCITGLFFAFMLIGIVGISMILGYGWGRFVMGWLA
jgi:hypothetical protein